MKTVCCLGDSLAEGEYGISGKSGIANVQPEGYPYFLEKITGFSVRKPVIIYSQTKYLYRNRS